MRACIIPARFFTLISFGAMPRKTLKGFMDSFKNGLIEMFKEEGDSEL